MVAAVTVVGCRETAHFIASRTSVALRELPAKRRGCLPTRAHRMSAIAAFT
jgi:hypothetical protein